MTAGADTRAATSDIASAHPEPVEQDLVLAHALQRATELFGKRQFAEAARILTPFTSQGAAVLDVRLYSAASRFYANRSDSSVYAAVERDLKVVLKTEPENLTALEAMGSLRLEQGRWVEALDSLSRVILFKPTDADVREKAGACAQAAGDLPQARAHFDTAAALRPGDAELWYSAGNACALAGQHEEALARFQKCLSLKPRHRGAGVGAAHCLNELGRSEEAAALEGAKE
jgi:Flp pilus assembly protein TadD